MSSPRSRSRPLPPPVVPYRTDGAIPEGYVVARSWQSNLIIPSAFVFGTSYFATISVGAASNFKESSLSLAVPIAGPFVFLGYRLWRPGYFIAGSSCFFCVPSKEALIRTALLVDGLTQLVSSSLLLISLFAPTYTFERKPLERWSRLRFVPMHIGGVAYGFGVQGTL
jgi:hypothetical protein